MSKRLKEGRRIRSIHPLDTVSPYIMPTRCGASNMFKDAIELNDAEKYILQKRREGCANYGFIHLFLAAYVRTVSQRPGINRFIRGQRVYARNKIQINMVVKKELTLNAEETIIKVELQPDWTAKQIYEEFNKAVTIAKEEDDSSFDGVAKVLHFIPGLFLKNAIWFLKLLDYFGLLPRFLVNVSPFHGSMFVTALGSLGIPPVFHHLYDFGNLPIFFAYGAKRHEYRLNKNGETELHKLVDYTVVMDERICDGHYFASAFKLLSSYFRHPEVLDVPPEQVVEDIK